MNCSATCVGSTKSATCRRKRDAPVDHVASTNAWRRAWDWVVTNASFISTGWGSRETFESMSLIKLLRKKYKEGGWFEYMLDVNSITLTLYAVNMYEGLVLKSKLQLSVLWSRVVHPWKQDSTRLTCERRKASYCNTKDTKASFFW